MSLGSRLNIHMAPSLKDSGLVFVITYHAESEYAWPVRPFLEGTQNMGKKYCIAYGSSMCTPPCPPYAYTMRMIVCISYVYQVKIISFVFSILFHSTTLSKRLARTSNSPWVHSGWRDEIRPFSEYKKVSLSRNSCTNSFTLYLYPHTFSTQRKIYIP